MDNKASNRRERERRREVIAEWTSDAKAIADEDTEAGKKKRLHRELKREALARKEDAARTVVDFENIIILWNKSDKTEAERVGDHEWLCARETLDWQSYDYEVSIPQPISHVYCALLMKGDFLDTILDCPHDIHETTSCKPVCDVTGELDDIHKELLYYRSIRYWSPQQIAKWRGLTDRNIRKVYGKMIEDMRYELFYYLYWRYKKRLPITTTMKAYVIAGVEKYGELQNKEVDWELNEEDIVDESKSE